MLVLVFNVLRNTGASIQPEVLFSHRVRTSLCSLIEILNARVYVIIMSAQIMAHFRKQIRKKSCCCTITIDGSSKISKGLQTLIISAKGLFSISLTHFQFKNGVKMTPKRRSLLVSVYIQVFRQNYIII